MDFVFCRLGSVTDKMTDAFKKIYNGTDQDPNKHLKVIDIGAKAEEFLPVIRESMAVTISSSKQDAMALVMAKYAAPIETLAPKKF